jgi:hypothetical protein
MADAISSVIHSDLLLIPPPLLLILLRQNVCVLELQRTVQTLLYL